MVIDGEHCVKAYCEVNEVFAQTTLDAVRHIINERSQWQ